MGNTKKPKEKYLPKTKIFFESIEEQFKYYEKNEYKYVLIEAVPMFISGFIFLICFFPLIPTYIVAGDMLFSDDFQLRRDLFDSGKISYLKFMFIWGSCLLGAFLLILFWEYINNLIKKIKKKHSIDEKYLNFLNLYQSIKKLELFIINNHDSLIKKSSKYLNKYYSQNFLNRKIFKNNDKTIYTPSILRALKENNNWLYFSNQTELIINALDDFKPKIIERVKEKLELEKVISILNYFLIYEYIQIKRIPNKKSKSTEEEIINLSNSLLECSSELINKLEIPKTHKNLKSITSIFKSFNFLISKTISLFTNKSVIITFFSWCILLSVITFSSIYLSVIYEIISLDSTIFIGALSIIIVGSITISAAIYTTDSRLSE